MYAASKQARHRAATIAVTAAVIAGVATGCTTHPPITAGPAGTALHSALSSAAAAPLNTAIVTAAHHLVGSRYAWGGGDADGPTHGITPDGGVIGLDASGLVVAAVAAATDHAVLLAHADTAQFTDRRLTPIAWTARLPGDLVFFGVGGDPVHVGILDDGDTLVSAEGPQAGVRRDPLATFTGPGVSIAVRRLTTTGAVHV